MFRQLQSWAVWGEKKDPEPASGVRLVGSGYELGRGGQSRVLFAQPRLAWVALDSHSVLNPDVLICRAGITLLPASRGSWEVERGASAERLAQSHLCIIHIWAYTLAYVRACWR